LKKKLAIVLLLVIFVATATVLLYAADVKCPIDGSSAYFTGQTKTDVSGKFLWLYKCNQFGHEFWVVK
jgi:hypothetical protein